MVTVGGVGMCVVADGVSGVGDVGAVAGSCACSIGMVDAEMILWVGDGCGLAVVGDDGDGSDVDGDAVDGEESPDGDGDEEEGGDGSDGVES